MYSQCQKFVATILLFSLLLQSCGTKSNIEAERVHLKAIDKATCSKPKKKAYKPKRSKHIETQVSVEKPSVESYKGVLAELSQELHDVSLAETSHSSVVPAPPQSRHSSGLSPTPPTRRKKPTKHVANKPRHVALEQESMPGRIAPNTHQVSNASTPKPPAPLITTSPADTSQPYVQAGSPSPKVVVTPKDSPIGPYSLPGGESVSFNQVDGQWRAAITTVHSGLSRTETLPILCEGEIGEALRGLEVMDLVRTRSHIQILETDQSPWAPRVVYLGELGLKGGMERGYSDRGNQEGYFELNATQIAADTEMVKMSMAHIALNMMIPEQYETFCRETYEVFDLLQRPVNAHELTSHLRSLLAYVRHVPIITNAIPLYVATFEQERAEVVGVVIARFLLPTGRLSTNNSVSLCRASCNTLLEGIRRILAEQRISGNAGREEQKECDALHTEATQEAQRQLAEQERVLEQEERRLVEEQRRQEQQRKRQEQEERQEKERQDGLRTERGRNRVEEAREEERRQQQKKEQEQSEPADWYAPLVRPELPTSVLAGLLEQNLKLHQDKEEEQKEKRSKAAERRRQRILSNAASRLEAIKNPQPQEKEPEEKQKVAEESSGVNNEPKDVHELEASQEIIRFIGRFEGFRTNMYKVRGAGRWTIGYGHEFDDEEIPRYEAGITRVQAQELLHQDVQEAIRKIRRHVTVPLTQHQFDALVSYVCNTGSLFRTELLKNLNTSNFEAAAREMDITTQNGVILSGLVRRRAQEQKLFLEGDYGN